MITTKTLYRVPDAPLECDLLHGFWISENPDVSNMTMKEAFANGKCIDNSLIDESIRKCIIFTFYDAVNYVLEEDEFREFTFEELIQACKPIEVVAYE